MLLLIITPLYSQQGLEALRTGFSGLKECYEGRNMGYEEQLRTQAKMNKLIKENDANYRKRYPVYFSLIKHLNYAIEGDVKEACLSLRTAQKLYSKIDKLPFPQRRPKKHDYEESLGISQAIIDNLYSSEFNVEYEITISSSCNFEEVEEEVVEEEVVEEVVEEENIQSEGIENPIELLFKAISRNSINSEHLEIVELVKGDGTLVPGQNGIPYEIRLKNKRTKKKLYFESGKYIIQDNRSIRSDNYWDEYTTAMNEFNSLVITILEDYALDKSSYHIFVQGFADKPTFTAKKLIAGYDTDFFQNIKLIGIRGAETYNDIFPVGEKYDNNELPDLRAAYVKSVLLEKRIPDERISIVKGKVRKYPDPNQRNCSIILYVDWQKAGK
jgi:hypothetical protein